METTPPRSQRAADCPIAFVLHDTARGLPQEIFELSIRPEELTRSEPSNIAVQQTLGGFWVDEGGEGIATLSISGTTGWGAGGLPDGYEQFQLLHTTVFERWHSTRAEVAKLGYDPAKIKLIFSDGLNGFAWEVTPNQFTLRRSRSRPLLHQYQIAMTKIGDEVLEPSKKAKQGADKEAAKSSLDASIQKIGEFADKIKGQIASALGPISSGVKALVVLTTDALTSTRKLIAAGTGAVNTMLSPVMEIAQGLTKVGVNVFQIAASIKGLPQQVKAEFMAVGSAFMNAFCLLRNALKAEAYQPYYDGLFGASSCSSTSGGRPASPYIDQNVFPLLHPATPSPTALTSGAEQAINSLATVDVLKPPALPVVAGLLSAISSGVTVVGSAVDKAIAAAATNTTGALYGAI